MLVQKIANAPEFRGDLGMKLAGRGKFVFMALALQFAEEVDDGRHPARGAGPGATMSEAPDIIGGAGVNGGLKLLDLAAGLLQIEVNQFAQIFRVAI